MATVSRKANFQNCVVYLRKFDSKCRGRKNCTCKRPSCGLTSWPLGIKNGPERIGRKRVSREERKAELLTSRVFRKLWNSKYLFGLSKVPIFWVHFEISAIAPLIHYKQQKADKLKRYDEFHMAKIWRINRVFLYQRSTIKNDQTSLLYTFGSIQMHTTIHHISKPLIPWAH